MERSPTVTSLAVPPGTLQHGGATGPAAKRRPKPVKPATSGHRPGTRAGIPSLATCQIATPKALIREVWQLVHERRRRLAAVLDLGAGDARFAAYGRFARYVAVEIDPKRLPAKPVRRNVVYQHACALDIEGQFDLCISNPPYIRHQDLTARWKTRAAARVLRDHGVDADGRSNAYLYFLWFALATTHDKGLCAFVVPPDWVSRPSAVGFRAHLKARSWAVDVYHLGDRNFDKVRTTACITIIDKSEKGHGIRKHYRRGDGTWMLRARPSDRVGPILNYAPDRGHIYACRGFSTGSQTAFVLTDLERRAARISRRDCLPCITSMRHLPKTIRTLDEDAFEKHYVQGGRRCWLLRTDLSPCAESVKAWLSRVPAGVRKNWTCSNRPTWYRYGAPAKPQILYASGFHGERPLFLENPLGARAIGAVHGVHGPKPIRHIGPLLAHLRQTDFGHHVVAHAGGLKKIDVRQMNGVLVRFSAERQP